MPAADLPTAPSTSSSKILTPKTVDRPAAKGVRTTVRLTDLLKVESKKEPGQVITAGRKELTESFTTESLHATWKEFTETRKSLPAEYQLLSQPYDVEGTKLTLHLLSPVQETMLGTLRSDLITFLREKLRNDSILVEGQMRKVEDTKILYTSRDKFEYLQEKIPVLKELKERLGLDTDF